MEAKFVKSQAYGRDKSVFGLVHGLFDQFWGMLTLCLGLVPFLWDVAVDLSARHLGATSEHEITHSLVFLSLACCMDTVSPHSLGPGHPLTDSLGT